MALSSAFAIQRGTIYSEKKLERHIKYIDEKIDKYLQELDEGDACESRDRKPDVWLICEGFSHSLPYQRPLGG